MNASTSRCCQHLEDECQHLEDEYKRLEDEYKHLEHEYKNLEDEPSVTRMNSNGRSILEPGR